MDSLQVPTIYYWKLIVTLEKKRIFDDKEEIAQIIEMGSIWQYHGEIEDNIEVK